MTDQAEAPAVPIVAPIAGARPRTRSERQYAGEDIRGTHQDGTARAGEEVLAGQSRRAGLFRVLPFLGPAFVAAIAYMDPGNFATNITAGAEYGYLLIWVIVASNLMAMLIQAMSAKLGIASGRNLPEMIRERFPRRVSFGLWVIAELVAMATDLAEFLGAALGLYLLFGIPLFQAGLLTGAITFGILLLQRRGVRPLEAVIAGFIGVIGVCYLVQLILGQPDLGQTGKALINPRFDGTGSLILATGMLGATVMPHVIYLHSSLTQNRIHSRNDQDRRRIFRFELVDIGVAMTLAGLINAAMLLTAAAAFWSGTGSTIVGEDVITEAYQTLTPLLGGAASAFFAIALIASGISSSTVGTMAGQVIMRGFLGWQIPLWARRLITMIPALVIIYIGVDPVATLVISQVILSFGIPFALVPLIIFTANRKLMGNLANRRPTTIVATVVATIIISLNVVLLWQTFFG
jgi:manganese transport protein